MGRVWRRRLGVLVAVLAGCVPVGMAEARGDWRGGVYIGVVPPFFVAPPVVISPYPYHHPYHRPHYPPVPYYSSGPYYAAPPRYSAPAASEGCYAGPYVCPLEAPSQVGMPCSCPTVQGPAWGRAR